MSPDGISGQRKPAFRPVIVTAASLGIRGGRLDSVGSTVDEQLEIPSYRLIGSQEPGLHTSPSRFFVPRFRNSVKFPPICREWCVYAEPAVWNGTCSSAGCSAYRSRSYS